MKEKYKYNENKRAIKQISVDMRTLKRRYVKESRMPEKNRLTQNLDGIQGVRKNSREPVLNLLSNTYENWAKVKKLIFYCDQKNN